MDNEKDMQEKIFEAFFSTKAGGSGLGYDPASGQYTYAWKTEKAWANTCRVLSLQLTDGTEHRAAFKFK